MLEIQSATAENTRGKKNKKIETTAAKMYLPAQLDGHK